MKIHVRQRPEGPTGPVDWTLTIPQHLADRLFGHLFPGDHDEHGAIIQAGIVRSPSGLRLLARDVVLARDGIEYVPGKHGYRMLTGQFVTEQVVRCRNDGLVYLAVHNHGGGDAVAFSRDDLASHRRGYPALLDVMRGRPVGALVFAENAVAGELWLSASEQLPLRAAYVLSPTVRPLYPEPPPPPPGRPGEYDRQARVFGDRGQDVLSRLTVGVIGAGGAGSLIVDYLGRLGVGRIIVADPDRIELTNVPRVSGSTHADALPLLTAEGNPRWLQRLGRRFATPKVRVMERVVRRASRRTSIEAIMGDFVDDETARRFVHCDFLFLAADTMKARLVFNAIVHGYLIPGVQVGAKVPVDKATGAIGDVFTVSRPVWPSSGCLWCNQLITPAGLQREGETEAERRVQRYVDDEDVAAPSVITLNATAAAQAVNDFLFAFTGLTNADAPRGYWRLLPRARRVVLETPRKGASCPHCSVAEGSALARGDDTPLPTRELKPTG